MTASVQPRARRLQPSGRGSRCAGRPESGAPASTRSCRVGLLTQGQEPVRHGRQRRLGGLVQDFPGIGLATLVQGRRGDDIATIAPDVEARTKVSTPFLTWLPGWAKT